MLGTSTRQVAELSLSSVGGTVKSTATCMSRGHKNILFRLMEGSRICNLRRSRWSVFTYLPAKGHFVMSVSDDKAVHSTTLGKVVACRSRDLDSAASAGWLQSNCQTMQALETRVPLLPPRVHVLLAFAQSTNSRFELRIPQIRCERVVVIRPAQSCRTLRTTPSVW